MCLSSETGGSFLAAPSNEERTLAVLRNGSSVSCSAPRESLWIITSVRGTIAALALEVVATDGRGQVARDAIRVLVDDMSFALKPHKVLVAGEDLTPSEGGRSEGWRFEGSMLAARLAAEAKPQGAEVSSRRVLLRADAETPYRVVSDVLCAFCAPTCRLWDVTFGISGSDEVFPAPLPTDVGLQPGDSERRAIDVRIRESEGGVSWERRIGPYGAGGVEDLDGEEANPAPEPAYEMTSIEDLTSVVLAFAKEPGGTMRLRPEGGVAYRHVFAAIRIAREAGIAEIVFDAAR